MGSKFQWLMSALLEALERELEFGSRWIPRPRPSEFKVAFVAEAETEAPLKRRNQDFVDSIAKALGLGGSQYALVSPGAVPSAHLWIFFGDLPVFDVKAETIIRSEPIGKLVESVALKKELWIRLKAIRDSGVLT